MERPNINELLQAMQRLQIDQMRRNWRPEDCKNAREVFRIRLEQLGVAQLFNWDEVAE